MSYLKNLVLFALIALIASCQSGGGSGKTKNGFNYTVNKKGSGPAIKVKDIVFFTVKLLADTTVMEESKDPNNLPSMQLPADWATLTPPNPFHDIFSKSRVGDSITLQIPVDSLPKGNPDLIGKKMINYIISIKDAKDSLSFVKYIDAKKAEQDKKIALTAARIPEVDKMAQDFLKSVKAGAAKMEKTSTGLQYSIIEKGTGPVAKKGEMVSVDYYGVTLDGKDFDNSFKAGQPIQFPVGTGNVIPGWDEALMLLPKGTKAFLHIPSNLAYGEQGSGPIGPNSILVFYVEVK